MYGFLIGFMMGGLLAFTLANTSGTTIVQDDLLDEICKQMNGADYVFHDERFMEERFLHCKKQEQIVQLAMPEEYIEKWG